MLERLQPLAGIAVDAVRRLRQDAVSRKRMLFTHRGLSGPAILQISSYWREGEEIGIDMLPGGDVVRGAARGARAANGKQAVQTVAGGVPAARSWRR